MATETTNLQLKKPAEADFYSVADFNDNWDKVDAAVGATKAAEAYDPAAAYALGAFCTKDGKLWKCSTAIPAGEAWNEAHWREVTLAELLEGKQDALTFDATPTEGSTNPVTSGGVAAGLEDRANTVHTHAAEDINSGTLSSARLPTVPVNKGGTGATAAAAARTNLGAAARPIKLTATVPTASWALSGTCYQQTVAVAGLLASDDLQNAEIIPVGNKSDAAAQVLTDEAYSIMAGPGGGAWCSTDGQLLLRCPPGAAKPAVNFTIAIAIVR